MRRLPGSCALFVALLASASAGAQTSSSPNDAEPAPAAALLTTVPEAALSDLPSSNNLFSLLETLQPEVISDRIDTGGLSVGQAARVGAHGSSWTQTLFRVGDADITDPDGSGAPLLLPGVIEWREVDISTGLMNVEQNAPGLAVTLQPARPGETWQRRLEVSSAVPGLQSRTFVTNPPQISRLDAWNDVSLFASGPILPRRLGIVFASSYTRSGRFDRTSSARLDAARLSAFANLVYTPSSRNELSTIVWAQAIRTPSPGGTLFGLPSADESDSAVMAQMAWEHRDADEGLTWRAFASYASRGRTPDFSRTGPIVLERMRDGPPWEMLYPGASDNRKWQIGFRGRTSALRLFDRRHETSFGLEVAGGSVSVTSYFTGRIGELVNGIPARVWDYSSAGTPSRWTDTTFAMYAGDRFMLRPGLMVSAGLRFETERASAEGGTTGIAWANWLPRAGLRWHLTEIGHITFFTAFGRYGYRLPLRALAYGDSSAPGGQVSRWNATSGDHVPREDEIGALVSRVGPGTGGDPGFSAIDPNLRRPYMDEFVFGWEGRPREGVLARLAAIARRDQQLLGVLNVGAPVSSYAVTYVLDPGVDLVGDQDEQLLPIYNRLPSTFGADRYLLANAPDDRATFAGVDLSVEAKMARLFLLVGGTAGRSEGWSGNRGFMANENDQGVLGEVYTNPNAATYAKGRVFTERGYTLKASGVYRFGGDVRLGVTARYQDGEHFSRLVVVPDLNQGAEMIRAFANGRTRFTYTLTVDARLQKGFTLAGHRMAAMLDAYNLFNTATEVEEFSISGPTSRLTAAVQPPRVLHLGLRLMF